MTMKKTISRLVISTMLLLVGGLTALAQSFPYPSIPQDLRTPTERGAYLLAHYWDNINFTDTAIIDDKEVLEQGFVNFIDFLPRMENASATQGIKAFAQKSFSKTTPKKVCSYFANLTEHYLYNPNSPLRNDDLYLQFLAYMTTAEAFDETEKTRYDYQKRNLSKNQVGSRAADFAYIDRTGKRNTLYKTEAEYTMIYFNDPDCDNCHAITKSLAADSIFTENPHLTVLAVYPDGDNDNWKQHPQPFPSAWIDAYSPNGEIAEKQIYFIHATPTIYLLDRNKNVILKDCSPQEVRNYLSKSSFKSKKMP